MKNIESFYKSLKEEGDLFVDLEELWNFTYSVFLGMGLNKADAEICAYVLAYADKRGVDTHGVNRLKSFYFDRVRDEIQFADTNLDIIKETETTAVVDANHGMGMVAAHRAMKMSIEKAAQHGVSMVVVKNSTHYGAAGYYSEMAANAGMIGINGTNARPAIAPTFGVENMLGTNPFTFAFPSKDEFNFCLDPATSIAQRGKIELYSKLGKTLPEGWVISDEGKMMTDPDEVLEALGKGKAALLPLGGAGTLFGGYKGYGFALLVEIFSAALSGGKFMKDLTSVDENGNKKHFCVGHFFMTINIESFMGTEVFKNVVDRILNQIRNSKKAPGEERIFTPGEPEFETYLERKKNGVKINQKLKTEMISLIEDLGFDKLSS